MRYREDYSAAQVPMLPSITSMPKVTRQILCYTVALVSLSLVLAPVAHFGRLYTAAAGTFGTAFLFYAVARWHIPGPGPRHEAVRLFHHVSNGGVCRHGPRHGCPPLVI